MPSYEADLQRFEEQDTHVMGISIDSVPSNAAWAKSLGGISYDLLSDFEPKGEVAKKYGVLRPEGYSERALFVVDKNGKIAYVDVHDISKQPDNEEIFDVLRKLS
jgi:peroxiredoxin